VSKLLTPMELYHAAKETCVRLYVANGGNPHDHWVIRPFVGTAAIALAKRDLYTGVSHWTLCMPAMPLNVRLPRWQADLIGAYVVHELLHALWTDWEVVAQSRRDGVHALVNALEDNRIETKANTPALVMVTEARRLLEALNAHIAQRALNAPGFELSDPAQFSFVLNLVIFREKLGYASTFPANWRGHVRREQLPLFDLALARFDTLASTQDCLTLAHDLKALASTAPKPAQSNLSPRPAGSEGENEGENEGEITESESEDDDAALGDLTGAESDTPDDAPEPVDGQEPSEAVSPQPGLEGPPAASGGPPEGEAEGDDAGKASQGANTGDAGGRSDHEPAEPVEPVEDVSDATQRYEEAHLNDIAEETARGAGKDPHQVTVEAANATTILNVPLPREVELKRGGSPKLAGEAIASPARLRRHLTQAVKSPERVANERRQPSGRLDMRNLVGLATGAPNVFRRRVEEEGREAAVSILLDVSGSMAGPRLAAAKAMALHMGDALKAAGVKFEITGFDDASIMRPKAFTEGWAEPTRRKVAGLTSQAGTGMLPAMKACAERLLKVGNVTRRILLVLTDGQDSYSPDANAALCAFYQGRGVEIVGIGLMTNSVLWPFAQRACVVWDTRALSTEGLKALIKLLDGGAPRAA
jgi:Mg-chelatase subunit ChlD